MLPYYFTGAISARQVRVQGKVRVLPVEDAEKYFQLRPEGSRYSAAASHQSSEIDGRSRLEDEVLRLRAAYPDGDVPRPEGWLGYHLTPEYFEFWQGQDNRSPRSHRLCTDRRWLGDEADLSLMLAAALIAFGHFLAFFALAAALVLELSLITESLSVDAARRIQRADRVIGISAVLLLLFGFLRVLYFERGSDYYFANTFSRSSSDYLSWPG